MSGPGNFFYLQQSFGKTGNPPSHAAFAFGYSLRPLGFLMDVLKLKHCLDVCTCPDWGVRKARESEICVCDELHLSWLSRSESSRLINLSGNIFFLSETRVKYCLSNVNYTEIVLEASLIKCCFSSLSIWRDFQCNIEKCFFLMPPFGKTGSYLCFSSG